MIKKKVSIQLPQGLQALHAAKFVQKASFFYSEILVIKAGRSVNGKSIMGVMSLAARGGSELTLLVTGKDEQEAGLALEEFLLNKE
ncbi:HPr family phosphocarrier protein [Ectobacillus funiculus]|uniref:HPr family phosphocarrier protein n=1 Tax=Ectobacillus funiculus TaxID=137993 RepID=UPI00397CC2C0